MLLFAVVSLFFLFWICVQLADIYLRHSNSEKYVKFLENYGVSLTPFQFRLYLTNFDRHPWKLANFLQKLIDKFTLSPKRSQILALWFTLGALVSLICFVATPIYLFRLLLFELGLLTVQHSSATADEQHLPTIASQQEVLTPFVNQHSFLYLPLHEHINAGITPIFPGINLPFSHMPIFLAVLIVASIVHEAGHAIAATNANVRVTGLGVFLFAIYPGAFTEVENDELDRCSYAQKLRIFGAGIWHNIILTIVGVLLLISIPVFSLPLYSTNAGVTVVDVDSKSGISGPTGLQPGYQILHINQCEVWNAIDWARCFARIKASPSAGFLAQYRAVRQMTASSANVLTLSADGEVQCCNEFNVTNSTHICFRYLEPERKKQQPVKITEPTTPRLIFPNFPDFGADFEAHPRWKRANLKMRLMPQINMTTDVGGFTGQKAIDEDAKISQNLSPTQSQEYSHACLPAMQITEHAICETPTGAELTSTLPPGYVCVVPALFNDTVLLRFRIKAHQKSVLFIGYLHEPFHMVEISELTPRFDFIPWWFPRIAEIFARYLITLSLAMGILNAVPCYGLDGQFINSTVIDYFCQNYSLSLRKRIEKTVLVSGTFIFCSSILIGFVKSIFT